MFHPKLRRNLYLEKLESRMLLAGDIVFAEPLAYPAGGAPNLANAGDVNLDGVVDLVVHNWNCCGTRTLLLGEGDGIFGDPIDLDRVGQLADMDNDGDLDMIAPGGTSKMVRVMLNEGIDTQANQWQGFEAPQDFLVSRPFALAGVMGIADFDGDDDLDIAVTGGALVWVLLNQGPSDDGWQGLGEPQHYGDGAGNFPDEVVPGDLDGDGDLDLVINNYHGGDVAVLMGNGDGTFEHLDYFAVGNRARSVNLGDLDGDGDLDIAAAVFKSNSVAVLLGNGDGSFAERIHYRVSRPTWRMTAADFDSDGDLDLATSSSSRSINLLINNGDGTFFEREESLSPADGKQAGITAADLDGDGDMDLVHAGGVGSRVNVLLNITEVPVRPQPGDSNGDGAFNQLDIVHVLQAAKYLTGQPATFEEGDWNGDGLFNQADIVAALQTDNYLQGP